LPEDLSEDAKRIWNEVTAELRRIGALDMTVPSMISLYCSTFARAQALEALATAQPMIETPTGPRLHPAGVEARKLARLVDKLATDLGLRYSAKSRIGMAPTRQDDAAKARRQAVEDFLFHKGRFLIIPGGKSGA